jgi:hypothetical protein
MSQKSNCAIAVIGIDIGKELVPRRRPRSRGARADIFGTAASGQWET